MKIPENSYTALNLFTDLLNIPSPSGSEKNIAIRIQSLIQEIGYKPEIDPVGNVLVRIEGQDTSAGLCVIAAHIDEIGFVVTKINPDGTLFIKNTGGLLPFKIGERPVEILGDNETITGVTSMGAGHGFAADKPIKWEDVKVITGLSSERLAKAGIRPGSCGVPLRSQCGPILLGDSDDPLVAAWTFDDRMGAVALLRLLKVMKDEGLKPWHPTLIAFTAQEEVGCQGAIVLAQREKPETFISVDGSPIPANSDLKMDDRPATWSMDKLGHFDQELIRFLVKAALEAGTELQTVVQPSAACDASAVFAHGGAYRVADLGHVRENSHGYEVAKLSVFDNVLKILAQFIRTWK